MVTVAIDNCEAAKTLVVFAKPVRQIFWAPYQFVVSDSIELRSETLGVEIFNNSRVEFVKAIICTQEKGRPVFVRYLLT